MTWCVYWPGFGWATLKAPRLGTGVNPWFKPSPVTTAVLQGLKGVSEGGKKICLFAYCKLEQTLGTRSGRYERSVCLPHYVVSVSHSNQRLMQMLNFPIEIISCSSWQEGPKIHTPGLIFAIYVVFRSMQNRNVFLLRRKSLFVPLHKSSHVLVSSYNYVIYVISLGVYSCVVWMWIWI